MLRSRIILLTSTILKSPSDLFVKAIHAKPVTYDPTPGSPPTRMLEYTNRGKFHQEFMSANELLDISPDINYHYFNRVGPYAFYNSEGVLEKVYTSQELIDLVAKSAPDNPDARAKFFKEIYDGLFGHLPRSQHSTPSTKSIPTKPPEFYQGLRGPETPPDFIRRVYGEWLGNGLDRAHIRQLDPKLSVAINNWLSRPENKWPPDVDLPTRSERNRRLLDSGPDALREHLERFTGSELVREAARLNAADHYRNNTHP